LVPRAALVSSNIRFLARGAYFAARREPCRAGLAAGGRAIRAGYDARMIDRRGWAAGLGLVALLLAAPVAAQTAGDTVLAGLRGEAAAVAPLAATDVGRAFLSAVDRLAPPVGSVVFHDSSRTNYYTEAQAAALPDTARERLVRRVLDARFFYTTRYGTPLAYLRALDLAAAAGLEDLNGAHILDYGYGTIGHLRLLALNGASVVGVEVDPLLRALYAGAQGRVGRGSIALLHGRFPGEPGVSAGAGGNFDLILSKNTLKRGYVHPERPVDKRLTVDLGVTDSAYVAEVYRRLSPGGLFLIYNLSPAPSPPDQPYKPWADGRSPFDESLLEAAGFVVVAFDRDDSAFARRMAHALGWDQGPSPMDLEKDLFGTYTLARKPGGR
jgi:SAM-dependent methyltransferase